MKLTREASLEAERGREKEKRAASLNEVEKLQKGQNKTQVPKRCTKAHTSLAATISKANTELEVPSFIKKAPQVCERYREIIKG